MKRNSRLRLIFFPPSCSVYKLESKAIDKMSLRRYSFLRDIFKPVRERTYHWSFFSKINTNFTQYAYIHKFSKKIHRYLLKIKTSLDKKWVVFLSTVFFNALERPNFFSVDVLILSWYSSFCPIHSARERLGWKLIRIQKPTRITSAV